MKLTQLFETTVNYHPDTKTWMLRRDMEDGRVFPATHKVPNITLADARPVVDPVAKQRHIDKKGQVKVVYAFIQGTTTNQIVPEEFSKRPIRFVPGADIPFIHLDDSSPFDSAPYVEFTQKGAFACYEQ